MAPEIKTVNNQSTGYGQNVGFGISRNPAPEATQAEQRVQPDFSGNIEPTPVQQEPVYSDPNFNSFVKPWPYRPEPYTFNDYIDATVKEPIEAENKSFTVDKLVEPSKEVETVGLPMDNLIVDDPKAEVNKTNETKESQTVAVSFDGLVVENKDPRKVQEKFAVQSLPLDADRSMIPKPMSLADSIAAANAHLSKSNQAQTESNDKKVNNWFTRLLDQRGQDYISSGKLTYEDVSRNVERIIDDMISGRIDYGKQGQYLINTVVIETLINYCSNKLAINKAIQFALGYTYNDYINRMSLHDASPERLATLASIDDSLSRNITQAIAIVNQDIGIYDILYKKLCYVNATKNASSLFSLTNDLNNYKKQIRKRY